MADSNLNKMIETALENIKKIADVNTIIGDPINVTGESTVIPVSRVTMGFTSGGIDYTSKHSPEKQPNFGGASAAGFNIIPIAFLVVSREGDVSILNVDNPTGGGADLMGTVNNILDKAPGTLDKIKRLFKKDKEPEAENAGGDAEKDSAE